jgi:hypothetical protein
MVDLEQKDDFIGKQALVVAMLFIDPKKETAKQRLTAPRR